MAEYCIYTDKAYAAAEVTPDHVIPLSLGGKDRFCVPSCKAFNSGRAAAVDAAISNDTMIMFSRAQADSRGHSNKPIVPNFKQSTFEGRPAQVKFNKGSLTIWDAISGKEIEGEEIAGRPISSNFRVDTLAPLRFAAKVVLGGAYFVYGDIIRSTIDCDELRALIDLDLKTAKQNPKITQSKLIVCDRFHEDLLTNPDAQTFKALCEFTGRSTFVATPHETSISFHVGVLGTFMSSVICEADTSDYPKDEKHDLGTAVLLGPGSFEQISLRELAGRLYTKSTGEQPPSPPA